MSTRTIPLTVSATDYRRLERLARADERGPFAMAGRLLRRAIAQADQGAAEPINDRADRAAIGAAT